MTTRLATYDLDGSERVHDLPWMRLAYTHVLNGPGSAEIDVAMSKVARADIEPGQTDYRIYQDETLRAEGRIWSAEPNTNYDEQVVKLIGEGIAGILARRLIEWDVYYVLSTETGLDPDEVTMTQQDILFDTVDRSQAELAGAGDLGVTQGTHTGDDHERHRRYCREDLIYCSEVFEDFAGLSNGLDWALTPTLTDSSRRELLTWNPKRGSALDGSIVLDGTDFLDDFTYAIDASQIVTRGRAAGEGDQPAEGDAEDAGAVATYGLLERGEQSQSPRLEDADETAEELISPLPLVAADVTYRLSVGPAIGEFDCGDYIAVVSSRPGWELTVIARVQEIQIIHEFPSYDDDDHTFVKVTWSEVGTAPPPPPPGVVTALDPAGAEADAISPDGRYVLGWNADYSSIRLWDLVGESYTDLGPDGYGLAVNNAGHAVVGGGPGFWDGAGFTSLGDLGSGDPSDTYPSQALSESDEVVGISRDTPGGDILPFIWTPGGGMVALPLTTPDGYSWVPGDINESGHMAGTAIVPEVPFVSAGWRFPVFYDATTVEALPGSYDVDNEAYAEGLNDSDVVIGFLGSALGDPVFWPSPGDDPVELVTNGGTYTGAADINNSGQVCGSDNEDGFNFALFWDIANPDVVTVLPAFVEGATADMQSYGLSDTGIAVGFFFNYDVLPDGESDAVIWS